jgi:hypothetical protein
VTFSNTGIGETLTQQEFDLGRSSQTLGETLGTGPGSDPGRIGGSDRELRACRQQQTKRRLLHGIVGLASRVVLWSGVIEPAAEGGWGQTR